MKRFAGAADRNKAPIAEVLARVLPKRGLVLEIASGTGQHASYFAERFPELSWQPSDLDSASLDSISAWVTEAPRANLKPPLRIDVTESRWPIERADAVLCINMVHITPWHLSLGLLDGAGKLLSAGAPLILYGPYTFDGAHTAPSNAAFDARLRGDDPEWGVRDAGELAEAAEARGLSLAQRFAMPANNFILEFRRNDTNPKI